MAIDTQTKKLLWSRSGGYCMNPACRDDLFRWFKDEKISSADELAHIIAESDDGPRGDASFDRKDRDKYDNLLVLCPTCHTIVDKNEADHPIGLLRKWKKEHEASVVGALVSPKFETRAKLKNFLLPLFERGKQIFLEYGPHSDPAMPPISDKASAWKRLVVSEIVPNNRTIMQVFDHNRELIPASGWQTVEQFRLHKEAFEYNHLSDDKNSAAPLFPKEIVHVLDD